jgi:hypothetical protein
MECARREKMVQDGLSGAWKLLQPGQAMHAARIGSPGLPLPGIPAPHRLTILYRGIVADL